MDKDELLERYEALGEDNDFLAARPLFEAEIQRRERSEQGLRGPEGSLLLRLAPGDAKLTWDRGELKARGGDPEGALADWRRAHELDPEDFSPVYSSAFLLEREGRLAEAAEAWRHIVDFATGRGWELTAAWPRQELQRVLGLLDEREDRGG
jgi:Flp pilus assembly protein TadD